MFAIAFDLVVADAAFHHPRGVTAAYTDIGTALKKFGFERIQGSVYVCDNNDMANLFAALLALKAMPWFAKVVRDIRGFRIENWSDFTPIIKGELMLERLEARDFRCFTEARLELHPETTLLVGRNAQGKTSLLEAACVLMRLQSPRTSTRTDLIRFGSSACMVEGRWREHTLRCGISATTRRLALDGAVCGRSADYLANSAVVVWMDHGDMNLIRGSGEHRRRFMDFAAGQVSSDHLHALQGYTRALRSRNYALKRDSTVNWRQADAYARIMDGFHQVLTIGRRQLLHGLEPHAHEVLTMLSMGQEALELRHAPGCEGESLLEVLLANRAEEERTRTTFAGAHRDDFVVMLNGRAADAFASEGQQRSLSLALKLAQARVLEQARGQPPLLLIDDVFGELDPVRRRALLAGLPRGAQKIITTTHLDWAGDLGDQVAVYQVEAAAVTRD